SVGGWRFVIHLEVKQVSWLCGICVSWIMDSSWEAISMGSPGAGKPHTGQYGELTPSRQRGGAGSACPLPTIFMGAEMKQRFKRPLFALACLYCLSAFPVVAQQPQYDLVIKGGRVIDPKNQLDSVMDVAIAAGKIARVAADIPTAQAGK